MSSANEMPTLSSEPKKKKPVGIGVALLAGLLGGDTIHGIRNPPPPTLPTPVVESATKCVAFGPAVGLTADGTPIYNELCSESATVAPAEVELAHPDVIDVADVQPAEPALTPVKPPKSTKKRRSEK